MPPLINLSHSMIRDPYFSCEIEEMYTGMKQLFKHSGNTEMIGGVILYIGYNTC